MAIMEDTGRLNVLVERVIAMKEQLDELVEDDARLVRPRPPASFELLVQAHRLFDSRGLAMPRDYERVLRAHDGIDHVWRSLTGSTSLFGHRELLAQRVGEDTAVISAVVIAASDDGEQVALVPGPTDLPAVIVRNANARVTGRFPSVTAWLEWILTEGNAELERSRSRRRSLARSPQLER